MTTNLFFGCHSINTLHLFKVLMDHHSGDTVLLVRRRERLAPYSTRLVTFLPLTVLEGEHEADLDVVRGVVLNSPHKHDRRQAGILKKESQRFSSLLHSVMSINQQFRNDKLVIIFCVPLKAREQMSKSQIGKYLLFNLFFINDKTFPYVRKQFLILY